MTIEDIIASCKTISKIIEYPIDTNNPNDIRSYLGELSAITGLSSELVGEGEKFYHTKKSDPEYCQVRVLTQSMDKNVHYRLTAMQSCLASLRDEMKVVQYQT